MKDIVVLMVVLVDRPTVVTPVCRIVVPAERAAVSVAFVELVYDVVKLVVLVPATEPVVVVVVDVV